MAYIRRYLSGQQATTVVIGEKAITEDKIGDEAVGNAQLAPSAVTGDKIQDGSIMSEDIGAGQVKAVDIEDGAVTESKLGTSSVTTSKLASNAVTNEKILDGTIAASKLAAAVAERPLAPAIVTAEIGVGQVTAEKLAGDAVETDKIKDDAVTADKIAAGAVGNTELAANAVHGTEIQDGAVSEGKIGTDAVTTAKIKDVNVTAAKLAVDSVETLKIKDANVTAVKLAADSVETAKIKDANVTLAKLEADMLRKQLCQRQMFYDDFIGSDLSPAWTFEVDPGGSYSLLGSRLSLVTNNVNGNAAGISFNDLYGFRVSRDVVFSVKALLAAGSDTTVFVFMGLDYDADNVVAFVLNTGVHGNWQAITTSGGVSTITDTGVAANTAGKFFRIEAGTAEVRFYIDDVLEATHVANITAQLLQPYINIVTLDNVVRTLRVTGVIVSEDSACD